ncbi:DUF4240 domain-containing protein [Brevifollis gellanilyticus]|uniref:DUF4240 domain-containing protein n=1 Tax=Brevifollis gellanilyticus TaxID=748831 RepID=A0A512M9K8_9BACT|nr:DUF4240 domain-containing protein [Brevifollis gellanilyticus]GEP43412.1 hypothetical protein BGE01nite_27030 [Brevifollis gellanilyticus]
MTEEEFWQIIDWNVSLQPPGKAEVDTRKIEDHLTTLPYECIVWFQAWMEKAHARASTRRIAGAAWLVNGGCSDDSFEDFVAWLISKGSQAYYSVLRDAESLVEVGYDEDPDFLRHSYQAAERIGRTLDGVELDLELFEMADPDLRDPGAEPSEDDFDDSEALAACYPRLWQHCLEQDARVKSQKENAAPADSDPMKGIVKLDSHPDAITYEEAVSMRERMRRPRG